MKKIILNLLLVLALVLSLTSVAFADERPDRPMPDRIEALRIDTTEGTPQVLNLDPTLGSEGPQRVAVHLAGDSVAGVFESQIGEDFDPTNSWIQQRYQLKSLKYEQDAFIGQVLALDPNAKVTGQLQRIFNAVMMEVDAAALPELAAMEEVEYIAAITDYQMDAAPLGDIVDAIGASNAHAMGYTGEGISIAILDSGIDYTHANFGGSGLVADYDNNDPDIVEPGTFPTAKVVGGYDFVGSVWPDGDLAPDPDPLDKPTTVAHGSHVGDIAAGLNGVAPGADLHAVKVCSSVSNSCSGEALLNGMDYAIDPNGDGKLNDAVDIVNMSLGSDWGHPYYDDLSLAVNVASYIGVLTVTSAGNAGDAPYILGTPAAAPSALAVAATESPGNLIGVMQVTAPPEIVGDYGAVWQSWSGELTSLIEAPLVYGGDVDPTNAEGCTPWPAGTFTGQIVLVDRGACNFTTKIFNIENGGGLVGIIGLVTPDLPFDGGYADPGGPITIPGYMILQADSNALKSGLPDTMVRFDPAYGIDNSMTMKDYSSRGPSRWMNYIKPDIAAPANILAAEAGTGTGVSDVGGTSSASPVVAGAAALVKEKFMEDWNFLEIDAIPAMIKSMLVTTGDTNLYNIPPIFGGDVAAISRIGGGQVRADLAMNTPITIEEHPLGMRAPNMSLGLQDVTSESILLIKHFEINNLTDEPLTYDLSSTYRFADDALMDAMTFNFPDQITVPARYPYHRPEAELNVIVTVDGTKLNDYVLNVGGTGGSGDALTYNEIDGYLWFDDTSTAADDATMIHLPWQILPRKSSLVTPTPDVLNFTNNPTQVDFANTGIQDTDMAGWQYDWLAHSEDHPPLGGMGDQIWDVDVKDVGVMTYLVSPGFCSAEFYMEFAITTYDRFATAAWAPTFYINLNTDADPEDDYLIQNVMLTSNNAGVIVYDLEAGTSTLWFYFEHRMNTGNFVFPLCGEQIGMTADDLFAPMDVFIEAQDYYYSDLITDEVDLGTIYVYGERYFGLGLNVPPGGIETWDVYDFGAGLNDSMGLMLLTGDSTAENENMTLEAVYP